MHHDVARRRWRFAIADRERLDGAVKTARRVAHELNNRLALLSGYGEMLADMERVSAPRAGSVPPGTPITVDDAQAFALYGASCEAGEPRGCEAAGDALRLGRGVARDLAQAAAFYEKGCEGGAAPSCHRLALLYTAGEGVVRDLAKAKSLFEKACQGGHQPACQRVQGQDRP